VVRKQEMQYLVWGDEPPDSGALRTHIHELRLQVDRSFDTALITTVHSVGWRMLA
jgi:DNA-binding response OmpR family regulator